MFVNGFTSSMTVKLKSVVLVTTVLVGREQKVNVLNEAVNVVAGLLHECKLNAFFVKIKDLLR